MVDFAAIYSRQGIGGVETIALGQPGVEGPVGRPIDRAHGVVGSAKFRRRRRATLTANFWPASRLKNHTPGLPPRVTYVLKFSSGKACNPGNGGTSRGVTPSIRNGTAPT